MVDSSSTLLKVGKRDGDSIDAIVHPVKLGQLVRHSPSMLSEATCFLGVMLRMAEMCVCFPHGRTTPDQVAKQICMFLLRIVFGTQGRFVFLFFCP